MTRSTMTIAVALIAALLAPSAFAQDSAPRSGRAPAGAGWVGADLDDLLALDEAQSERLAAMRDEVDYDLEPIFDELQTLEQELDEAWSAESPDHQTILYLKEWIIYMETLVRERHYELRLELLDLLDEGQRQAFQEAAAGGGEARGRRDGARQGGQVPPLGRLLRQLELDESQREEVRVLHEEMQAEVVPTRELMAELEEELEALWVEAPPEEDTIFEVDYDLDTLRLGINEAEVTFLVALAERLDAEQREALRQMMTGEREGGSGARGGSPLEASRRGEQRGSDREL